MALMAILYRIFHLYQIRTASPFLVVSTVAALTPTSVTASKDGAAYSALKVRIRRITITKLRDQNVSLNSDLQGGLQHDHWLL